MTTAVPDFGLPRAVYLRYLWIEKVAGSSNQIVYVPSDGGLPV
jgi:hypothetical protein